VAPHSGGDEPSSFEINDWDRRQIRQIVARFPQMDREEMEAELAVTLLELKHNRPVGVRDWRAYVATSLFHRAASLAKKWRAQWRHEVSIDTDPAVVEPLAFAPEPGPRPVDASVVLARIRHVLDAESYALLERLANSKGNQARAARELGVHRNTIRRRLRRIRQVLANCPIENVTGGLRLTSQQWMQLTQIAGAGETTARDAFKARLILALAAGDSYARIAKDLHTTKPTISRWKQRFTGLGVDGLRTRCSGGKPQVGKRALLAKWLRAAKRGREPVHRLSYRRIADLVGLSKSTVYRLLRASQFRKR